MPIGAITVDRAGETIAPLRAMAAAGAVAFSDDGAATKSLKTLYNAARYVADLDQPFLSHCDDPSFHDAVMHQGRDERPARRRRDHLRCQKRR